MSELEWRMLEKPDELGKFQVFDIRGNILGRMDFTLIGEREVNCESAWGRLELRVLKKKDYPLTISLNGGPLSEVDAQMLGSKLLLRMATGQEIVMKHSLIGSVFRSKSGQEQIEYRYRLTKIKGERGECGVKIAQVFSVNAESVALSLLALYGLQRISAFKFNEKWNEIVPEM